jgi:hypothetical protein
MQMSNLQKLNDMDVKEQNQITTENRFAIFEKADDNVDNNKAWKNIMSKYQPKRVQIITK